MGSGLDCRCMARLMNWVRCRCFARDRQTSSQCRTAKSAARAGPQGAGGRMKCRQSPARVPFQPRASGTSTEDPMNTILRLAALLVLLLAAALPFGALKAADPPVVIGLVIPLSPPGDPTAGQLIRRAPGLPVDHPTDPLGRRPHPRNLPPPLTDPQLPP